MNDELTREDLINIGEIDPDEPEETPEEGEASEEEGGETPEPEPEEPEGEIEEGEPEPEPEAEEVDETAPVPVDRFNKVYGERKEIERKFDLFRRLGPDKYYEVYPDEKPADTGPAATTTATIPGQRIPTFRECLNLPIDGGPHAGRTLKELWESDDAEDRADAQDLYNDYRDGIKAQVDETKTNDAKIREKTDNEHNAFYEARAKELFGKDLDKCEKPEVTQISELTTSIMDQMETMGVYNLENAYKLLTLDDALKNARGESIKSLIEAARKGKTTHIDSKKGTTKGGTGYDGLTEMTDAQVSAHLDTLSETGLVKFWENAPASFIDKHKGIAAAWT